MICYKDRTWCPKRFHQKCNHKDTCHSVLTHITLAEAQKWWGLRNGVPPISIFKSRPKCYKETIRVKIRSTQL